MKSIKKYLNTLSESFQGNPHILSFFRYNPNPTQDDIEQFIENSNIDINEFNNQVYQTLGSFCAYGDFVSSGKSIEDFDPKQIAMGIKVELEHTNNLHISKRITLDHLTEISDYYTRLNKMEHDAGKR